jgi:hypothetical protein
LGKCSVIKREIIARCFSTLLQAASGCFCPHSFIIELQFADNNICEPEFLCKTELYIKYSKHSSFI